jgi:N-acetyl-gamma-glutamyl-phosphate reductase
MIKVGIIGGTGYAAGELIRILLNHQLCNLIFVHSTSRAGHKISDIHEDLIEETSLVFESDLNFDIDVLFLCTRSGDSRKYLKENNIPERIFIIDLSEDFRMENAFGRRFIYGLPELNRALIRQAKNIANPGCFATAIELALLPLAAAKKLQADIHVSAITGSTGAGKMPNETTHYSWRSGNISIYNPFQHRHLREINKTLQILQEHWQGKIHFLPFRGNFTRGIFAACYCPTDLTLNELKRLYQEYYSAHPFVVLTDRNPYLKQVINTNKCILYLDTYDEIVLIISIIDNLIKGAAGQAVQNMNLMFNLDEDLGLRLKPVAL